ncbi:NAD(P)/FAD-dependent oxidoreductase [Modestobacter sp. KNN46-3]|jgi:pyruvate/2-oxoglutarate dehydrogenase complex dihydrolipoamide dehydrogenase (E3) component|uniref:dihydrolipoyl dehydrogenase family protein n=1 Tax=Modestobacter sp. KNN46-3 TaxID=2711218 RepID=UPI0013E0AA06|nr:NAD(P)/FAD-dependent oxidoreductase [Modestobacter sp. KNN46-3]
MAEHVDVAVIGMGPGGEVAASRLLSAGRRVAVIERELIGGECAYWACIPSKTVLRPPEAAGGVDRAAGADGARLDWPAARDYRDYMARHLDDAGQVSGYRDAGALVLKGDARISGPGRVTVDGRELTADHVIVATGSEALTPPIEGLDQVTVWTNRETYTAADLPGRALVVGGSAVGVETAQFLVRFGVQVTLLQRGDRLMGREEARVGELAEAHLRDAGVDVRTGREPVRARRDGADSVLDLADGSSVRGDVVIVATGRTPRTEGLGLEDAGVQIAESGAIVVDEHCRAAEGVWALGDVTGILPFTHVAKYQGRIVADTILGRPRTARYDGIPRVVFADPEIAAAGLTQGQARDQGLTTVSAEVDLAQAIARPWTYERDPRGHLGLLADPNRRVLLGAWAVAPQAGEWIHQASLAIRAGIGIDTLLDQVAQFPTYTEGYVTALEALDL